MSFIHSCISFRSVFTIRIQPSRPPTRLVVYPKGSEALHPHRFLFEFVYKLHKVLGSVPVGPPSPGFEKKPVPKGGLVDVWISPPSLLLRLPGLGVCQLAFKPTIFPTIHFPRTVTPPAGHARRCFCLLVFVTSLWISGAHFTHSRHTYL